MTTTSLSAPMWAQVGAAGSSAFSADPLQVGSILQATADIARSAVAAGGYTLRRQPDATEIRAAGWPFLCVFRGAELGGLFNGQLVRGRVPRQAQFRYPTHNVLVYLLYPHRNDQDENTYSTPEWAEEQLELAFSMNLRLNGTAFRSDILECCVLPEFAFVTGSNNQPYVAVKVSLAVSEQKYIDYTGPY